VHQGKHLQFATCSQIHAIYTPNRLFAALDLGVPVYQSISIWEGRGRDG